MYKQALAPLALLLAAVAPGNALAGSQECNLSLRADVALHGDAVELRADEGEYRFEGNRVWRNGRELKLSHDQQLAAEQYRRGMQRMVPAVSDIAVDGAMLGLEAVTMTFAALGADARDLRKYESRMITLSEQVHTRYNGRELRRGSIGEGISDFDDEIGELAEQLASDLRRDIVSLVFTAILNPQKIEARAEATERLVERRLQPKADALEARAQPLCAQFTELDRLEQKLGVNASELKRSNAASLKKRVLALVL